MARKETPDLLAELLAGPSEPITPAAAPAAPAPPKPQRKPAQKKPAPAKKEDKANAAVQPAPVVAAPASPPNWDYLVVSLCDHKGWRPRFINGREIRNWMQAPLIHDYVSQLGDDGWELAAAASGKSVYGSTDNYQLFFKRVKR